MPSNVSHSTEAEKNFIKRIGTFCERKRSRIDMLMLYKRAMNLRGDWGTIDKDEVSKCLEMEIKKATKIEAKKKPAI